MFGPLGRAIVRHPWWTIGAWLLVAAALIATAPELETKSEQVDFLPSKYESVQAEKLADRAFPSTEKTIQSVVVIKRATGGRLTAADQQKIGQVAAGLRDRKIPNVVEVGTGPDTLAKDGSIQLIGVELTADRDDETIEKKNADAVKRMRAFVKGELDGSALAYGVTGDTATELDEEESESRVLTMIGIATIVLIITLLLLIFRSPIAALLPIFVIVLVSQVSNAVTAHIGNAFDLNIDKGFDTIVLVVLYGIGTDYILFLLFRYRERLRKGEDKKTAMITSVTRVGEAIVSAGAAVIVAFLVLLLADFQALGALGPQLAIAVGTMLVTALTLVPALVSLLGRVTFFPSKAWKKEPAGGLWTGLGRRVGRRPAVAVLASGAVLAALAFAALGFKSDFDFDAGGPQNTESAKALKDLRSRFAAGTLTPTEIYLHGSGGALPKQRLDSYRVKLAAAPGVAAAQPAQLGRDRSVAKYSVVLKDGPYSAAAIDLMTGQLRDAAHAAAPPGTRAYVGGPTAGVADIKTVIDRDLSVVIPVAVLLIGLILCLLLRALVAPIYLVAAVLLGFAATLGATVILFQGARDEPGLTFQLPIILYLFVLAIGTDYNILMIARLREEAREGRAPRDAAELGVKHAGPTVAAAGVILAGTFSVLVLSPTSVDAQIGFGVSVGILLSAFVMSAFLVPGITALLGHLSWWPGHTDEATAPRAPYEQRSPATRR